MQRFRSMKTLQKFASVDAQVHNHFNQERHLVTRQATNKDAPTRWQSGAPSRPSAPLGAWRAVPHADAPAVTLRHKAAADARNSSSPDILTRATLYPTGQGCARQIWEAYSEIVRSLENFPELATLRMHFSAQLSGAR